MTMMMSLGVCDDDGIKKKEKKRMIVVFFSPRVGGSLY